MDPHRYQHRLAFPKERKQSSFRCPLSCPSKRDYLSTRAAVCKERVSDLWKESGDPCGNRTHVWGVRGPRLNLLTNGPSSARASLASFPRFAQEPGNLAGVRPYLLFKSKQPFRFETRGVLQWKNGTPSGTRTLDTLIKSQVLYQLS